MRRGIYRLRWLKVRRNRDGSARIYLVQPGRKPVRLPTLPESDPDFLRAYTAALAGAELKRPKAPPSGTLHALAVSHKMSATFAALASSSRDQRDRELGRLVDKAGNVKVAAVEARHIRADMAGLSPGSASNRLKAWRALMAHAVELGLIDRSPAADVKPPKSTGEGHRAWTADAVDQFRAHWAIGTDQRLALELASWTGARRSDLVRLGRQMVDGDGWLTFSQVKTKGQVSVPLLGLPDGCAELAEDHRHLLNALHIAEGRLLFLETAKGSQRSDKAMSAWFRKACDAAGIEKHFSLHGLRKYRAAALAELGWSEHRIGAWTGHTTLTEIVHYTRAANKKRMIEGTEQKRKTGTRPTLRSHLGRKT